MSNITKSCVKSTWTPLNNEQANGKRGKDPAAPIFEERRLLVNKWFEKWTDTQRKQVLSDLIAKSQLKQLVFAADKVSQRKPTFHEDFTRVLPRVLTLYVLSFLDPRSLCRCSKVCWYWKNLTELDHLWLPKCMRLGWILSFSPSPYEIGLWKRHYVENIVLLKCYTPKAIKNLPIDQRNGLAMTDRTDDQSMRLKSYHDNAPSMKSDPRRPWRGSDPVPKDTWRNNYLENDAEVEKVNKLRKQGSVGKEASDVARRSRSKINTGNSITKRPSSLPRSKSAMSHLSQSVTDTLYMERERPNWAKPASGPAAPFVGSTNGDVPAPSTVTMDATKRPLPVRTITVVKKPHRTPRDPPTSDLFPGQPWKVPEDEEYDSDMY